MFSIKSTLFILSGSLILAACTSFQAPKSNTSWQAQREWQTFSADGRMGVKIQDKGYSASFDWLRDMGVETFDVNTPLGNTVGQLCADKQGFIAIDSDGKRYEAQTAAQLSQQLLGYELPLQYLSVWANGEWVANAPYQLNADGTLNQYGWTIAREANADGSPAVLQLHNQQLTLKLLFKNINRTEGLPEKQQLCAARTQA